MLRTALALLLLCGPAAAAGTTSGVATVIDGDTLEVNGARLHLHGIDAPEAAQRCETAAGLEYRCGRTAARLLRERIGTALVTCERREGDATGRPSATCLVAGEDLAAWMVAQGHALASRRVPNAYLPLEGKAWATRRGLWAGTFEKPADWRRDYRRVEATAGAR